MNKELSIESALVELANLYKFIYVQSMVTEKGQTVESFKKSQHRFLDGIIDKLHNRYDDHIEGLKKEFEMIQ